MAAGPRHVYRQLLREIRRQLASATGNRAWAEQLRLQWRAAAQAPDAAHETNMRAARNTLTYLASSRRYRELQAEFSPKMAEADRIEKTARRVGLEPPKTFSEQDPPS
ncbi:hypothetical protein IWQ56_002638 [Coemansia nantahalensis]|uniref:Uncharacterized protein n=1 Tax=Coemansia nantahalensis TaxID=2789366 RepID=A0ACC1JMS4_9FUNG|nr:hypothetical protein IWQ57_005479 [Coemansia nantahalensis]KAJ2769213.1 hypothetical protein IWQ56_002638 [Coemansia nantahalensis]